MTRRPQNLAEARAHLGALKIQLIETFTGSHSELTALVARIRDLEQIIALGQIKPRTSDERELTH